jgi:hypothetical protein
MTLAGPIIGEGDLTIIGNGFTVMRDNSATFHGDWYQHTGDMFDYRPSGALGTGTLFWNSGLGGSWFSGTHVIHSNDVVLGAGLRYLRRAGDHAVEFAGTSSGPGGLHDGETYSTADAAVLILSGENTYNGATYASSVAWQSSAPRTVEIRGSLGNANIFVSSRLRGGSGPGQQGTVNFNIRNNTNDLIRVYPGGVLELDNLVLAVQFSGTQTSNEYVIADYSGAITTGEEFYEIQGLGALFVFGGIEYYRGEFLWRIHYAGTQANPGNKIVIARTVPLDAMLFLLR